MSSGRTLLEHEQNQPSGFFPKLFETVVTNFGEEGMRKVESMKHDRAAVLRFAYSLEDLRRGVTIRESYPDKNPYEYKAKKEYGNRAYAEGGRDLEALYFYTQAVVAAPCDADSWKGRDLAVALANRSAVLFSLKAFHLAEDDIRLALESGYPSELRFKLLDRRAKIETHFRQFSDARDTYRELINALDVAKCDKEKKMKMQRDAQKMLDFFEKAPKGVYNDPNVITRPPIELPKLSRRNPRYPAVSDCIQFRHEPGRGRFAVASRDVKVGEFICVENPLISRILPDYASSNCAHCFKSMKSPMPCPWCTKVMFCSYACRQKAMSGYHRYECKVIEFLVASGMSIICLLALRAITTKPLQFFRENRNKFQDHDETAGVRTGETKYLSNDYRNLYNLVSHADERKSGDVFHRAMLTVLMLRCLKLEGYFGEERKDVNADEEMDNDEMMVAELLNHFLEVLQFNSHEVAQFEMLAKNKEEGAESVFIGAAVYPTLAMFNHSCDPSIVRFYVEDTVCVQAIKNIRKGEEICENYGPIFFHSNREDRQDRLKKQYWFDCACVACAENWPLMHEMSAETLNFRCQDCGAAVPFSTNSNNPMLRCVCGTPVPMLQALKKIGETDLISDKAKRAMADGDLERAQKLYVDYLVALDEYLVPPYQDYYKIQQSIWKCIWMRHGNRVVKANMRRPAMPQDDDVVD